MMQYQKRNIKPMNQRLEDVWDGFIFSMLTFCSVKAKRLALVSAPLAPSRVRVNSFSLAQFLY